MSIAPVRILDSPQHHGGTLRRFSVDEYHRMLEAGILKEGDPVELLEGAIRFKMTKGIRHEAAIDRLQEVLARLLPGWRIRLQSPITTADSEPEPDLVVARGPASRYDDHHPHPDEIALVVEVSDSSLEFDREDKARVYARAGIGQYWIVNLREDRVEVYASPAESADKPAYLKRLDFAAGERIPVAADGKPAGEIQVGQILPKRGS